MLRGKGGGKAVIWGDPATLRSEALIRAYARFVHGLAGRYLTAEDVGTTQADMDLIRRETPHVTGVSPSLGGSGDPSPATAWGVLWAMRAAAAVRWGSEDLAGRHVVVSGVITRWWSWSWRCRRCHRRRRGRRRRRRA